MSPPRRASPVHARPLPSAANKDSLRPHREGDRTTATRGLMAEPSLVEQVATLNATLRAIEERMARGQARCKGWRISRARSMMCASGCGPADAAGWDDYKGFQERVSHSRARTMRPRAGWRPADRGHHGRHRELAGLREAANRAGSEHRAGAGARSSSHRGQFWRCDVQA